MAVIPVFSDITKEGFAELLTKTLNDMNKEINTRVSDINSKMIIGWVNNIQQPLPIGWYVANGTNGTDDMQKYFTNDYIYIQKIR